MENEGSLQFSQEPATGPYREAVKCSIQRPILFLYAKLQFNIILSCTLRQALHICSLDSSLELWVFFYAR
jgi:hypothetical protein